MANFCPTCGFDLDKNVSKEACDICGAPFAKKGEKATAAAPADPKPGGGLPPPSPPSVPPRKPPAGTERTGGSSGTASREPEVGAAPKADVEPEPEPEPSPVSASPATMPSPASGSPPPPSALKIQPYEIDAKNAFEKGKRIITVIGFANSGKSFFVNRLRNDLQEGRWRCDPGAEDEIATSPLGLELTKLTPPKRRKGRPLNYVLVDLAGESFKEALGRGFQEGKKIEGFSVHSYLEAMTFASAYVLLIRFEDVRGILQGTSGGDVQKVQNLLKNFHDILGCIVVGAERLRRESPEDLLRKGISKDELSDAFDRELRCDKPICVLFSQADRVESELGEGRDDYDQDPLLFAMQKLPRLYNPIAATFRDFRFDFLSAFQEHNTGTRVDYRLPSHGALEAFLWLHGLLDHGHSILDWPRRLARGSMPTRRAIEIRRWLDGDFRTSLRKIEEKEEGI
jgi:hypothetical protein